MTVADLSKPERRLQESFPHGAWTDFREADSRVDDVRAGAVWGPGRIIRADVLRALLLGRISEGSDSVPGVRLRGARIVGRLDLTGATIPYTLTCDFCHFDDEIVLAECTVRTVQIVNSSFPAFDGVRMRVDGMVSVRGCSGVDVVLLDQARIVGEVCLSDASIGRDIDAVAVSADGLSVDGDVNCVGLVTCGSVSMQGLQATGSLDLTGAQIRRPGRGALSVGNASIRGRIIGRSLQVDGEMLVHDTVATRIELTGAQLRNPDGLALSAGGLAVTGGMFCSGGFTAHGAVWLVGARLEANLSFAKARIANPGKIALKLDRATIGDFDGSDLDCAGRISMLGVRVASDLSFERARIVGSNDYAIAADGAVIDGSLRLAKMAAVGEVAIGTGRVGRRLILTEARLDNPGGTALKLSGTNIASDMFCRGASITGEARLAGTNVRGHLDLDRVRLLNPSGFALYAVALSAGELTLRPAEPIQGIVDLGHARASVIRDDPSCWPSDLKLDGLTYSALEPQLPAQQRLAWLAPDDDSDKLQPYEQLASYYNGLGQPGEARVVLYAKERRQRRNRPPLARTWGFVQDVTVAYGYQPWRAVLWLILLLAAGSIVFSLGPPPPLQDGAAPHFNAFIYTLDLLLPVVDLGQRNAFNPAGAEQWLAYFLVGAGWVLATTIAAGAARVLSRR